MLCYLKYKNKFKLPLLAYNKNVYWTAEMIEECKDRIKINLLYSNNNFNSSEELLDKYGNDTIFWNMTYQKKFWTRHFLKKYASKINWFALSNNLINPWSFEILDEFQDYILWPNLSYNKNIPWTLETLEKFKHKIIWKNFAINRYVSQMTVNDCKIMLAYFNKEKKINSEFIKKHFNNIYWSHLSSSDYVDWGPELIGLFKDQLDWKELSANESIPWSMELIKRYKNWWNWEYLSGNKSLPWTDELLEYFKNYWESEYLSINNSIPWTPELIRKHKDLINFDILITNKKIPWETTVNLYHGKLIVKFSIGDTSCYYKLSGSAMYNNINWSPELIERFKNYWRWDYLSDNKSIPWTVELIERFENYWDWEYMSYNETMIKKINDELTLKLMINGFMSESPLSKFRNDPLYDRHLIKEIVLFL